MGFNSGFKGLKLVNIGLWNFRAIRIILNWTVALKMVLRQFTTCSVQM